MTTYDRPFGRYFEDFEPGDVYRHWPGKTITEADDHLFCMITMNHHPLHTNAWFAEHETVQGKNVVVGNLVYSLVLGMSVPDVSGAAIANLEVESLVHRAPTFHGDTIYAETKVIEKVAVQVPGRPRRGHRRDQGVQPARRRGLLLPSQGDGVEAGVRSRPATSLRGRRLGLTRTRSHGGRRRSCPLTSTRRDLVEVQIGGPGHRGMGHRRRERVSAPRAAMALDPRPVGSPGRARSWPSRPSCPGWCRPTSGSSTSSRPRRRAPPPPWPTCCGSGRGSATTAGRRTSTAPPRLMVERHGGSAVRRSESCWPFPAWGTTRHGPCWPSPSTPTSAWSTPTPAGCWPGPWPDGRSPVAEAQGLVDAMVPEGGGGRSDRRCSTSEPECAYGALHAAPNARSRPSAGGGPTGGWGMTRPRARPARRPRRARTPVRTARVGAA